MKEPKTIRKFLIIGAWLLVIGSIAVLLLAANRKDRPHLCKGVAVTLKGEGEKYYIGKADIAGQIKAAAKGSIVKKPINTINLAVLEASLEKQLWIKDAELFFDNRDVLHVLVWEREPVARVFTTAALSFYIDSVGQRMPLLPDVTARVPIITNFTANKKLNKGDSVVLKEATSIANYITANPFWNAQIAEIDITDHKTFELVPVLGNHTVRIGNSQNLDEKFARLFLFYKQVMAKAGFDKYAVVNVQFKNQVIASNDKTNPVDSLQLQKNIKELIERTRMQLVTDSIAAERATMEVALQDSLAAVPAIINQPEPTAKKKPSNPVRTEKKPIAAKPKAAAVKPKPKAVMKKKN